MALKAPNPRPPAVRYIVFDGSGVYTPAYAGVLSRLTELSDTECDPVCELLTSCYHIKGIGGVSGGSMMAMLVCAGVVPSKLEQLSERPDVGCFACGVSCFGPGLAGRAASAIMASCVATCLPCCFCANEAGMLLLSRFYYDPIDAMEQLLVMHNLPATITFAELAARQPLELRVGMADAFTGEFVVASAATTPDMPVATAVAASAAHPSFTKVGAIMWRGRTFYDGAFAHHVPRDLFGPAAVDETLFVQVSERARYRDNMPSKDNMREGIDDTLHLRLPVREVPGERFPLATDMVEVGWLWMDQWMEHSGGRL